MGSKKGFTLWEVMLVLMLLGILAYVVIPDYNATVISAKSETNRVNVVTINNAVRSYFVDTGVFPYTLDDLITMPPDTENWQGPYLDKIPEYPLDPSLSYRIDPNGNVIVQ